jgi:hypothetical protein
MSVTVVGRFTSSATLDSSWVNTNYPTTPTDTVVWGGMDATIGASSAIYIATIHDFFDPGTGHTYSSYLMEAHFTTGSPGSSSCEILLAVPGDIYNIGGVSNEPTTHIEFTMWDNSAYSSKGKGK